MRIFYSALNALTWLGASLSAACVGVTAAAYVVEVVARYAFSSPLNGASDLGSYMLCAAVFLALPQISRNRAHVSISILPDSLPAQTQIRYRRLLWLTTAAVLLVVAWFVAQVGLQQFRQGVLTPMANQIPRWWLTAIMGAGLALSAIHFIFPQQPASAADAEV